MARRMLPALLLAAAGLLGLLPAAAAAPAPTRLAAPADDPYPSTEDIAKAQADADARAGDVAAIEARLTAAQTELEEAGRAAEQAVEAYNGAQARLVRARAESAAAAERSAAAETARAAAAERAAGLLAEIYRQGASPQLSALNALLGARGPGDLSDQAAAVGVAGAQTRQILDDATATAAAAARARTAAQAAEDNARRAADAVRLAKEQAEARLTAQQAQVADIGRRREQLLADLAAARNTTVDLERQRREALEAIAARQAEEAAKAAAAANRPDPAANRPWSADGAAAAIAHARALIGLPYIWGGEGPDGYDCSGLTMTAWQRGGKRLTHFAADQYAQSTPVSYRQLRPGDLVFWTKTGRAADIYHVALYIGDDQMIEAPRPGAAIKQASLWIMGTPDFYARP
ncbi:C40 family peptidase [Kitasatospora paracochleata]|uniref:Cell wall-associated NlpC family hydrolase n=1 Tax=Kitasatospora paracochleata TaxID=58354 RepID=A0ABT1J5Q0_9ACTN|nr:C40 family peptidase [Kitasatospora paracochleata]MCP2312762.1 cell wall-associated NlpC family hydrolase [Kitasatospora paracochleata]